LLEARDAILAGEIGGHLSCPPSLEPMLFRDLVVPCWARIPPDRPSFSALRARLHQWRARADAVDRPTAVDVDETTPSPPAYDDGAEHGTYLYGGVDDQEKGPAARQFEAADAGEYDD
jgi:hypothetical protein